MKMKLLQKKGSSLAAMFTAVIIACLGLTQRGEAVVMWEVSEVGGDVTIIASGTLNLPGTVFDYPVSTTSFAAVSSGGALIVRSIGSQRFGGFDAVFNDVVSSAVSYNSNNGDILSFGGDSFGVFAGGDLILDGGVYTGSATTVSISNTFMTVLGVNINDLFGSALDNGPLVVWESVVTGDSIQIGLAAVPEPSSTALLGLGGLALMLRRRR